MGQLVSRVDEVFELWQSQDLEDMRIRSYGCGELEWVSCSWEYDTLVKSPTEPRPNFQDPIAAEARHSILLQLRAICRRPDGENRFVSSTPDPTILSRPLPVNLDTARLRHGHGSRILLPFSIP